MYWFTFKLLQSMSNIHNYPFSFNESKSLGEIDFYVGQSSIRDMYPCELFPDIDFFSEKLKSDEVGCEAQELDHGSGSGFDAQELEHDSGTDFDTQELEHDSGTDFDAQELEHDFEPMYEGTSSSVYQETDVDGSRIIQCDVDSLEITCAVLWNLGYFGGQDRDDGSDLSFLVAE